MKYQRGKCFISQNQPERERMVKSSVALAQGNDNSEEGSGNSASNKLGVGTFSQMKMKMKMKTKQTNNSDQKPLVEPQIQNNTTTDGSLALTLIHPDVLDCPICSDSITIPVFQCKNGHLLCSSCCVKLNKKCPSCSTQIENTRCGPIEKVLQSLKMPCQNTAYGCKEIFLYSEKRIHEKMCIHLPCSCPLVTCSFVGTPADLATHCRSNHSFEGLWWDRMTYVNMGSSDEYKFFQEKEEGTIFIVRNKRQYNVNVFSVSCIGPPCMKIGFSYELIAPSYLRLQSTTKIVQRLPTDEPEDLTRSLIVPSDWFSRREKLLLWIWKKNEQPDLMDISERKLNVEPVKKRKIDTPKPPMSAFFVFMEDFKKLHKEKFPDNKSIRVVGKAGGEKWKAMSVSEKAPYVAKAEEKKAEYEKAIEEFNKKNLIDDGEQNTDESDSSLSDSSLYDSSSFDESAVSDRPAFDKSAYDNTSSDDCEYEASS